jgi:capsid protein
MEFPSAMEVVPDFIKTAMKRAEEVGAMEGFGVGENFNNMEPGTATNLPFGVKPVFPQVNFPAEGAVGFNKDQSRAAAVGCQMPLFRFTGDYSEINFSSGRLGMDAWHNFCERLQAHMITNYRRPHFNRWLFAAMTAGVVKQPMSRYKELCRAANFYGRRWEYIQPVQDAQADILNIESKLISPSEVCRKRGGNFEKVCQQIKADIATAKAHGIEIGQDVSLPTITKGAPDEPQATPDDEPVAPKPGKKSAIFCMECGTRAHNGEALCKECGSDSISVYKTALEIHAARR